MSDIVKGIKDLCDGVLFPKNSESLYPINEFNVKAMCDRLELEDCRFKPQVLTGADSIDFDSLLENLIIRDK